MTKQKKIDGSTVNFVPIKEVKEGIVVLDDGTLVAISLATSINLSLKSAGEQTAILNSFKAFLNTLDFPVQIAIQSRKMDIEPYIKLLESRLKDQENELIKLQIMEYIAFIKNFTENINVMEKQFFLVVSYKSVIISGQSNNGFLSKILGNKNKKKTNENEDIVFRESRIQLEQRVSLVNSVLSRTGVKTKLLDTEAVLEVFYSIYNPGVERDLMI